MQNVNTKIQCKDHIDVYKSKDIGKLKKKTGVILKLFIQYSKTSFNTFQVNKKVIKKVNNID